MPPCLTLSSIRCGTRVKWVNPGKGVTPFPIPWCGSYRKGNLRVTLDYRRQLYLLYIVDKFHPPNLFIYIFLILSFLYLLFFILGSAANLSRTTASISSVGTFVNRLTTSKLTIWLEWMGASLILPTKWAEFLTNDKDLPVSGPMISTRKRLNGLHAEPRLLTMRLNGIPSLWIFERPYMCGSLLFICHDIRMRFKGKRSNQLLLLDTGIVYHLLTRQEKQIVWFLYKKKQQKNKKTKTKFGLGR